ncbi:MAG: dipeptidase [Ignavibacteria bacterium]|jgi:membrane dipeptidase
MKFALLLFLLLFLSLNFTCFTGKTDNRVISDQEKTIPVVTKDTNQIEPIKMDSVINKFLDLEKDAFKLHYDAIVIDTHNDILMPIMMEGADITKEQSGTQSDLVRWKKGGLDVQVFSIYVPEHIRSGHYSYALKLIAELEKISNSNPEMLQLVYNYDDLAKYLSEGKFCGLMGAEGGDIIEGSLDKLENIYNRGVRYLGLTWNTSNAIGVSARDESERGKKGGLTDFGKELVKKMDELGMMIDVSHLGETAFWDVVNTSKNPIIASHSCVYNLCPHYRNLKDDQIQAIAKSGGIICVNFYVKFLDPESSPGRVQSIHDKYRLAMKPIEEECGDDLIKFNEERYKYLTENTLDGGTPIDKLIDHIDYIVKLAGIDHVGLGSDFDGGINTPNEIYDASCYPIITKKLIERGYKEDEIRKILGLNFLRVFKQVCG